MRKKKVVKNRDGLTNSDHWATPKYLYDELNEWFHFDFDPCPLNHDIKKWDGLKIDWGSRNFMNPPYNRIEKPMWIRKGHEEYLRKKMVVMLIPAATGTRQFHKLLAPSCPVRLTWSEWKLNKNLTDNGGIIFMEGRIAFEGYNTKGEYSTKNKGKHDSMIVVLSKKNHNGMD